MPSDRSESNARPSPWRDETLEERLSGIPWYLCSLLLHLLVLLLLTTLLRWTQDPEPNRGALNVAFGPEEGPPLDSPEPSPEDAPDIDQLLDAADLVEDLWVDDAEVDDPLEELPGDSPLPADVPFAADALDGLPGLLGPAGGRFGARRRGAASYAGSGGMESALTDGLEWLARHQSDDGSWDSDRFMREGRQGPCDCEDGGGRGHDVGVTSLALLAFLGAGNTTAAGPYRDAVTRGVRWLRDQQQSTSGLLGRPVSHAFLYSHALGTMALCEAYHATRSPILKRSAVEAVHFIQRARNPYGAWRYRSPPDGDNDTSVTGWMVFALATAADAGLEVDPDAFDGALGWINQMTSPSTGRVGYHSRGADSIRGRSESMTAVGLLSRIFIAEHRGHDLADQDIDDLHAELLLRSLPSWKDRDARDMYYWYYGTYAMFQRGGRDWERWEKSLETAIVRSQHKDGHARGSWDPDGPWGGEGGRVYSTALMTLCLEVYFRYDRLTGSR